MPRALKRWSIFVGLAILVVYILAFYSSLTRYGSLLGFGDALPDIRGGIPPRDTFRKWRLIKTHFPVARYIHQPGEAAAHVPRLQHDFTKYHESDIHKSERHRRRQAVQQAFEHSWHGYTKHAWRHDELMSVSGGFKDSFGAWGATLVDSLDTLWIMGLEKEFDNAAGELRKVDFTQCNMDEINLFETTIRYLGGLLGAYDLTDKKYNVFLHKAIELGEMLYHAFDTPNHMPLTRWNWKIAEAGVEEQEASTNVIVAEIGSLTLEFTRLTQLTGDNKYFDVVQRVMDRFRIEQNQTNLPGLWPLRVNARDRNFHENDAFTMGGQADSLYEYLPKQYLLLQGRDNDYKDMYEYALETAKTYLAFEPLIPLQSDDASSPATPPPPPSREAKRASYDKTRRDYDFSPDYSNPILLGTATSHSSSSSVYLTPLGQHLSCYAGGMVALSARAFAPFHTYGITEDNLDLAERLVAGCVWSYRATPSKIGPELFVAAPCRKGRAAITSGEERDWTGVEPGKCRWDREKWLKAVRTHHTASRDPAQLALEESSDPDFWENEIKRMGLKEGFVELVDSSYRLRPETVESLFVLWRITGNPKYQDIAWEMFEAIESVAKTKIGYAGVADVMQGSTLSRKRDGQDDDVVYGSNASKSKSNADGKYRGQEKIKKVEKRRRPKPSDLNLMDSMESFWTAETLKYLYLIFAEPNVTSLDEFVFNTEGHPLRWRRGAPPPGKNNG